MRISVIGGGLAGSEAAWQIAERGLTVDLYEMRPHKFTPAHHTGKLAELVCSNSLGGKQITSGGGLLKAELMQIDSLIIKAAYQCEVPAAVPWRLIATSLQSWLQKLWKTIHALT